MIRCIELVRCVIVYCAFFAVLNWCVVSSFIALFVLLFDAFVLFGFKPRVTEQATVFCLTQTCIELYRIENYIIKKDRLLYIMII